MVDPEHEGVLTTSLWYSLHDIMCCLFQLKEYEKCEDYWSNKLEEERHLYDQEQQLSDEKFSELMSKIREYEEMFGAQEDNSVDSDRLSTIEERGSLEKQVILLHSFITVPLIIDSFQCLLAKKPVKQVVLATDN